MNYSTQIHLHFQPKIYLHFQPKVFGWAPIYDVDVETFGGTPPPPPPPRVRRHFLAPVSCVEIYVGYASMQENNSPHPAHPQPPAPLKIIHLCICVALSMSFAKSKRKLLQQPRIWDSLMIVRCRLKRTRVNKANIWPQNFGKFETL